MRKRALYLFFLSLFSSSVYCHDIQKQGPQVTIRNHMQHYWPVYVGIGALIIGSRYAWRNYGWVTNRTFHTGMNSLKTSMQQGFQAARVDLAATEEKLMHTMHAQTSALKDHLNAKFFHLEQRIDSQFNQVDGRFKHLESQELTSLKEQLMDRIDSSEKNIIEHINNLKDSSIHNPQHIFLRQQMLLQKNPAIIDEEKKDVETILDGENKQKNIVKKTLLKSIFLGSGR